MRWMTWRATSAVPNRGEVDLVRADVARHHVRAQEHAPGNGGHPPGAYTRPLPSS